MPLTERKESLKRRFKITLLRWVHFLEGSLGRINLALKAYLELRMHLDEMHSEVAIEDDIANTEGFCQRLTRSMERYNLHPTNAEASDLEVISFIILLAANE